VEKLYQALNCIYMPFYQDSMTMETIWSFPWRCICCVSHLNFCYASCVPACCPRYEFPTSYQVQPYPETTNTPSAPGEHDGPCTCFSAVEAAPTSSPPLASVPLELNMEASREIYSLLVRAKFESLFYIPPKNSTIQFSAH
jgi:hypothetical protein